MAYLNPILIEIFCEIRFGDQVIPVNHMMQLVRSLEECGLVEVEIQNREGILLAPDKPPQPFTQPVFRCWNAERTKLVQVSSDLVAVNQVGTYLGWDVFSGLFDLVVKRILEVGNQYRPRTLSLHTIDKMDVAAEGRTVGAYLNCDGSYLAGFYRDVATSCDVSCGRGLLPQDGHNEQFQIQGRRSGSRFSFTMNAAFSKEVATSDDVTAVLERLHSDSTRFFEGIITDEVRNVVMKGNRK